MKTENEDPGYTRRNIPIEYEDYIAQTFGYDSLTSVPKNQFKKIKVVIKERFSQTGTTVRKPYAKKTQIVLRGDDETELDFAKRVDSFRRENDVTITQEYHVTFTPGTVPGDIMISGDAETLSLSDLKPETVKQVAAELLEQEKSKTRNNEKLALLGMRYGRQVISSYATPIFDLKSFGKPTQDLDEVVKKWRESNSKIIDFFKEVLRDKVIIYQTHDEIVAESVTDFAERWGQMLLDAIPKKHAFISEEDSFKIWQKTGDSEKLSENDGTRRFWPIPENGPEQIVLSSDLKIETNQQWTPEQLKDWLKSQPGNTKQERKPYFSPDLARPYREPVMTATSNDGLTWFDEIKVKNYSPDNWPTSAPPYNSAEGWEFEKAMKLRNLKSMFTIEWLEKQQTEKHALVAKRLREILAA